MLNHLDKTDDTNCQSISKKIINYGYVAIPYLEKYNLYSSNYIQKSRIYSIIDKIRTNSTLYKIDLWKENGEHDIFDGLLILMKHLNPNLDVQNINQTIQKIVKDIWLEFHDDLTIFEKFEIIKNYMFNENNFKIIYYENTEELLMLNHIFENKEISPFSLNIIYNIVCNRLQIPIYLVDFPNQFIIMYIDVQFNFVFYINIYEAGKIYNKQELFEIISKLNLKSKSTYYNPCSNKKILSRLCVLLIVYYEKYNLHKKVHQLKLIRDRIEKDCFHRL